MSSAARPADEAAGKIVGPVACIVALLLSALPDPASAAPVILRGFDGEIVSVFGLSDEPGCTQDRGTVSIRSLQVDGGMLLAFRYVAAGKSSYANLELDWIAPGLRTELGQWLAREIRPGARLSLGIKARGTGDRVELVDAVAPAGTHREPVAGCADDARAAVP